MENKNNRILILATVNAYGTCVFICVTWSQSEEIELTIVVSEIGEQWLPKTDPVIIEEITAYIIFSDISALIPAFKHMTQVMGSNRGYRIAIVPQIEPIPNENIADRIKIIIGRSWGYINFDEISEEI